MSFLLWKGGGKGLSTCSSLFKYLVKKWPHATGKFGRDYTVNNQIKIGQSWAFRIYSTLRSQPSDLKHKSFGS